MIQTNEDHGNLIVEEMFSNYPLMPFEQLNVSAPMGMGPQGPQGETGAIGPAGTNGVSPTVDVQTITGGHEVTITDAIGEHSFDVMDGSDAEAGLVFLTYGVSNWADFTAALNANRIVYCVVPAGSGQYRYAFLAYRTSANAEFQYYRSVDPHSDSQQGDEVYIYNLTNRNVWTTTIRQTHTRVEVGEGLTSTYADGVLTISLDQS